MPGPRDTERRRHVGIADVAREAGVDPSTVSRVVNGSARVSPATRDRVESAVRRLRYRPNRSARYLATQRSMTIGVLLPEMRNLMHADFLHGAQTAAAEAGYSIVVCDGQLDPAVQAAELERFLELRVDGVLVTRSFTLTDLLQPFEEVGVAVEPIEVMQRPTLSAWRGRRAGSIQAVGSLVQRGHRRIAMFVRERSDAPGRSPEMRSRVWAAQEALRRHGLPASALEVVAVSGPGDIEAALRELQATAVISSNDAMAPLLLAAMSAQQIDITGALSFLSYGDSLWAQAYRPALSVIRYDYEAEGRTLVRRLLHRLGALELAEDEAARPLAPDVFVDRASIAPPRRD